MQAPDPYAKPAAAIASARHIVVVTGAGISAESGIRTFRDTMEGLWREFDPAQLATPEAFARDPERVTRWYDKRRLGCLAAEPNAGHLALAHLERLVERRAGTCTILTQNVDGLHQRAGSRRIVEMHGTILEWRCTRTGRPTRPPPSPFEEFPPRSSDGAPLRPNVVWFGELLPPAALASAEEAMANCDLFMSVGTSSVVHPVASYVHLATERAIPTIEVNPARTVISSMVTWSLQGKAGDVLPRLIT